MSAISLCSILLSACASESPLGAPTDTRAVEIGRLHNPAIDEASGLAISHRQKGRMWTMNDSGSSPILYAFAHDGAEHGSVRLTNSRNVDWEDLASFELDGKPWLLVADVGDNLARRKKVTLYIVEEPDLTSQDALATRQISFRYPDGPRDAESVAVDVDEQLAYVLSKRDIPAKLYSIPLNEENNLVTATYLGTVASIPQPTQDDLDKALAEENWHWQPTAMDFAADGRSAIILTYPAVYLYDRKKDETWLDALQRTPTTYALGNIKSAEAVSLNGDDIFITIEAGHAPLYRIESQK